MNPTRSVMWMLGLVLLMGGALLLYFEAGLNRWVSIGVMAAGLLLFLGLAIMGFASGAPADRAGVSDGRNVTVDSRPTIIERDDRRR